MPLWAIEMNSDFPLMLQHVAQFMYGTRLGI